MMVAVGVDTDADADADADADEDEDDDDDADDEVDGVNVADGTLSLIEVGAEFVDVSCWFTA